MGKKRKATSGAAQPKGPREFDPKESRLGPITTYRDVADSEDEYWMNQEDQDQDQIMFNDAPKSKKQKRLEQEEQFLEDSEEEVFDYDDGGSDDDEDELEELARKTKKATKKRAADAGSDAGEDEEEADSGWWGSSKKEYYNADEIQTEADALEEEQEARRIQKKRLEKMKDEDFIFNEDEWLADKPEDDDNDVVTEVLKDVEVTDDMTPAERLRLLQSRYPELEYLAEELLELQPLLVTLQTEAEGQPRKSVAVVKYRVLGSYVATLAMYFATLTSPARDSDGPAKALDPAELRDHEVMSTLLECREAWQRVKDLKPSKSAKAAASIPSPPEEVSPSAEDSTAPLTNSDKKGKNAPVSRKKAKKAERQAKELEDSLADLSALITTTKSKKKAQAGKIQDDNSDFGEEETIDSRAAAEKAARKKSLRFYTSQIVQKANKRAGAGRDAGGDVDIPYRERLRDRQARLNAEAEKRGKKDSKHGADLGDDSDEGETQAAHTLRDQEDEYYDFVAARTQKKKSDKAARAEALAAATAADRVVEQEVIGEDGKRKITYAIEKNKGLAPKRKKEVRNPRTKKRMQYKEKQKKLASMKATYKGGEGKGGYKGELTGIKPGLIKSTKL
ncbi:hypothetical protein JX265_009269 [Neoarthrinium moseri]|uniref:Sas10 C-terminal domain-containing protein n=1 Tax=Neoarthrinium moseri TaxID=1658444 RepID=A0A9P9WGV5_9PEZI|nr:hypothetical protein JX265_009269 [Neoarthrinium moseri]